MWWEKKSRSAVTPRNSAPAARFKLDKAMSEAKLTNSTSGAAQSDQSVLGRSIVLRGELSANEDLILEGQFEGNVSLEEHCLTIGPHGQLNGDTRARQVIIQGSVHGNVFAREKIEIRKTGKVVGNLLAAGIAIEDGGYLKGGIDILREEVEEKAGGWVAAPRQFEPGPQRGDGFQAQPSEVRSTVAQNDAHGASQPTSPGDSEPPSESST
jgi:cytoskeletal protein CcmA (bactofilin family)